VTISTLRGGRDTARRLEGCHRRSKPSASAFEVWAEVAVDAAGRIEHPAHELCDRREVRAAARPEDVKRSFAFDEVSTFQQRGKIGNVIGMHVGDGDRIEVLEPRTRLGEPEKHAAAGVNQEARLAIEPHKVARTRPCVVRNGTTRAEDLDGGSIPLSAPHGSGGGSRMLGFGRRRPRPSAATGKGKDENERRTSESGRRRVSRRSACPH